MKHAGEKTLNELEHLLSEIRNYKDLKERNRGVFYRKSSAFLHFHEDLLGIFADVRIGTDWKRFPVTTKDEQRIFLAELGLLLQ